ncbi:MAG TPA: glycosyltransferase family 1 protein, partial [Mucilaginibacter sp.]|nr:glycosyltransferase family 1 protein [Mucilaginibacter sp.]
EVREIVETVQRNANERIMVKNNLYKIAFQFNWNKIVDEYESFILECYENKNHERIISDQG